MRFDWDAENTAHLARHKITPAEAEEVILLDPLVFETQEHAISRIKMPNNKTITIPKFKTEAQEAAWWDAHPEIATEIMARAVKAGTARRAPLRTVTIRLPESDITRAQSLAEKRMLPYQTYIKMLLHEALEREGAT